VDRIVRISDLLLKYRTDKNRGVVDPGRGHLYGTAYDEILSGFDKDACLHLLEIGVQKGGSLLAWKEYFVNAEVTGVDIVDVRAKEYVSNKVVFVLSDIKNPRIKERFQEKGLDIIIDDGSHYIEDVLFVVANYLDVLNAGGVLVVEDVQLPAIWGLHIFRQLIIRKDDCFELEYKDMRKNGLFDDFLFVIRKRKESTFMRFFMVLKNIWAVSVLFIKDMIFFRKYKSLVERGIVVKKISGLFGVK